MIFGIDISSYQQGIDLRRARDEGIEFVIAKVTQGTRYRNPAWPGQRDGARAAGQIVAGYHYLGSGDPAGEAAACKAWLGDTTIPIMLDWEQSSGGGDNLRAVAAAFRAVGLRVVLGYLPRWYWQQVGSPRIDDLGLALVSSRYPTASTGGPAAIYRHVTAEEWGGYAGMPVSILQFTDRATVAGMQVDANAYLGGREHLAALLGDQAPSPVPRSEPDFMATMSEDDKNLLLEAARSVLFGMENVRDAGALALTAWNIDQNVKALQSAITAALVGDESGPPVLTDADVDRIAVRTIELLATKTSS